MALATNDVIQVSFRGTLYGQRILNILHYAVVSAPSGSTIDQLEGLANSMANNTGSVQPVAKLLAVLSTDFTLDDVRTQVVYPTRTLYTQIASGATGAVEMTAGTANMAVSILKRGVDGGRKGVGRMQIAGVPQGQAALGKWDFSGVLTDWADLRAALAASFTSASPVVTMTPVIYNPTGAGLKFQAIWSWTQEDTVRTMHRRTVRLGE